MSDKRTDLAGPGISTYEEVEKILPSDYRSLLSPKDTQKAITTVRQSAQPVKGVVNQIDQHRIKFAGIDLK